MLFITVQMALSNMHNTFPNTFNVFSESLPLQSYLIFAVVFLVLYQVFRNEESPALPPGPACLPFIGNVHKLGGTQMHVVTAKLARDQFGSLMTINLAGMKAVMLNDLKAIKVAFVEKAAYFSDRFQHPLNDYVNGVPGSLIVENGDGWKVHRRMTIQALRNFGMGKRSLENKINEEGRCLLECFEQKNEQPFDPQPFVQNAVANVICSISFGRRYEYDDADFRSLLDFLKVFFEELGGPSLVGMFPRLWYTPLYSSIKKKSDNCEKFLQNIVKQHQDTFDSNDIRDIIDVHLQANETDDDAKTVPRSLIWRGIFDLFAAGSDTTSNTIMWGFLLLTQHPDVQARVHQEIDDVIGKERPPTLLDRLSMPYLDATLMEIQRFRPVACFIPPKEASADAELLGYTIPKGTQIWANLYAVLHSPEHWEAPEEFKPERFLSEDGTKTEKPDAFIPFGAGRRICLGEQLARMELFLLMTNLLQHFTFKIPDEDPTPSLDGNHGITLAPEYYRICAMVR